MTMKIYLAQMNPTVGDMTGNLQRCLQVLASAKSAQAKMVVFPELALVGYPPEDILYRSSLPKRVHDSLQVLTKASEGITVLIGYPDFVEGQCFNAVSVLQNGKLLAKGYKRSLPNRGVFDEQRYFAAGDRPIVFDHHGICFGVLICEDGWHPGAATDCKNAGAEALIQINASPFYANRVFERQHFARARIAETGLPLLSVYCVGGQDELIFDGGSFALDAKGELVGQAALFQEEGLICELHKSGQSYTLKADKKHTLGFDDLSTIYQALVMGVRDYITKNGFKTVLLGLSGGIDSALTLAIAVDALGKDKVRAVLMPSQYTASMSLDDAIAEAESLGVQYDTISIEPLYTQFCQSLSQVFADCQPDLTEENIQARCRGMLLMAMSNKFGGLVLTTSNKSELAVGYSTLYGDMAGGFSVLKDVYKTQVYALAQYRNSLSPVIPERVITRAPTAELRHDQKDQDSLPPYDILDAILTCLVEEDQDADAIIAKGFDADTVKKVLALVKRNEYKRRQAAIGPKVTHRAFGRDWRQPVTSKYGY